MISREADASADRAGRDTAAGRSPCRPSRSAGGRRCLHRCRPTEGAPVVAPARAPPLRSRGCKRCRDRLRIKRCQVGHDHSGRLARTGRRRNARVRHEYHGHPGGAPRQDAIERILDDQDAGRGDAEPPGSLEIDVRGGLAMGDLVGRDDDAEERAAARSRSSAASMTSRCAEEATAKRHEAREARTASRRRGSAATVLGPAIDHGVARRRARSSSVGMSSASRSTIVRDHCREFAPMTEARSSSVQADRARREARRTSSHQISVSTRTPSRSKIAASRTSPRDLHADATNAGRRSCAGRRVA